MFDILISHIDNQYIDIFENIDIEKVIFENIDIDKKILINIDIHKDFLKNIDKVILKKY